MSSGRTANGLDGIVQRAPGRYNSRRPSPLGKPVCRGKYRTTVVLASEKTAYFGVLFADQTGYGNLTCPMSAALKFTPPQDTGTVTLHGSATQIAPHGGTTQHLDCGIVHVTPVTAKRFQ